ncbi:MAG TPA: YeeE/YedE thiosulfate transporter family protein [Saprospiraceae bacterium]|nr:YeeE/YedE family protein [Saprospiraceae bacterium]MCB9327353.1 YeeE/YedE family protein [Lewinellaceae bacterium]HPK08870.1 YeeE/YedE thiosulfate transporter family protein [Saprospiraceae bacterium]HPQ21428.1 YeeE/YedE thiosulfate transporter family protein [Saprospiraceae bacterium]HRX29289.1 YeeE/YedE thiosulfate transporter family protein [Saprospiraceae bacterium]
MKYLKFLLVGVLFGIIVTKSEIISWFRIQEMFRFDSFHMYGIIGTAVITGIIMVQIIKKYKIKSMEGTEITFQDKDKSFTRYILGGTIFGLGWALVGACPGPMFAVLGVGVWSMGIVFVGALLGTFLYGVLRSKLPH